MSITNALLLLIIIISGGFQGIVRKKFALRAPSASFSFTTGNVIFVLLFFIVTCREFNYPKELLPYSIGMAASFCVASVTGLLSIATGSLALSSLIGNYSLILPAIYGIAFLNEPTSTAFYMGLLLLLISIFLINFEPKGETKQITLKWIIFTALNFVSNGANSIIQKLQQMNFNGLYKNEFMIVAIAIVVVVSFVMTHFFEREKGVYHFKIGFWYYALFGILTGLVNFLVLVLSDPKMNMPASLMFPLISVTGMVLSLIIAKFMFKEKLSKLQLIGIAVGTVSIVFLSI